ncbi:uncharacterized protein GLRG_06469 [Colletotrichum graminicola M1.001]|uniref:Prenylated Rab acceptor 1 n=1 Tax=Colletotrichum graminicola (strain M1.001 / M2 / FGSC 10212) TaxID=645133 RepID=E3QKD7_COLGM|nr:uncharacterized protein GLRG_06469 [Colletotrichum graminicola M1.001]EFQ31325.1 hypothetical protein GLRG_06469 [Colletotrichum graminicola M1.001]
MGKTIKARAEERGSAATGVLGGWKESCRGTRDRIGRFRYARHEDDEDDEDDTEDSEDDSSDQDDDEEENEIDWELLSPKERDEALAQRALARVRRAQERGKLEVNLSKEEMAALERRRKRMEKEARKQERKQRQEKEQRFAIPLSQFEPTSRKRSPTMTAEDDLPRHPSPGTFAEVQTRGPLPPIGYFPPPNASRTRTRSATSASQRPTHRQPSDMSPASSATSSMSKSRSNVDPFQFQVEGPQVAASRRNASGSTDGRRSSVAPPVTRSSRALRGPPPPEEDSSEDSSEESSEESTSDGTGDGAQIAQPPQPPPPTTRRGRKEAVVVEEAATRESARGVSRGKKSANPSPSKRKPTNSRKKKK